jgi:hypothetical protein
MPVADAPRVCQWALNGVRTTSACSLLTDSECLIASGVPTSWALPLYFQFPLNHFARITEIKNSAGVELSYYF